MKRRKLNWRSDIAFLNWTNGVFGSGLTWKQVQKTELKNTRQRLNRMERRNAKKEIDQQQEL